MNLISSCYFVLIFLIYVLSQPYFFLNVVVVKVIIEGFKSYKEEVSTDPFSPKVNVVGNGFFQFLIKNCFSFISVGFYLNWLIASIYGETIPKKNTVQSNTDTSHVCFCVQAGS